MLRYVQLFLFNSNSLNIEHFRILEIRKLFLGLLRNVKFVVVNLDVIDSNFNLIIINSSSSPWIRPVYCDH